MNFPRPDNAPDELDIPASEPRPDDPTAGDILFMVAVFAGVCLAVALVTP